MKTNICKNCHFSQEGETNPQSLERARVCIRYPPSVQILSTQHGAQVMSLFPIVKDDQCCGEYKGKLKLASST